MVDPVSAGINGSIAFTRMLLEGIIFDLLHNEENGAERAEGILQLVDALLAEYPEGTAKVVASKQLALAHARLQALRSR